MPRHDNDDQPRRHSGVLTVLLVAVAAAAATLSGGEGPPPAGAATESGGTVAALTGDRPRAADVSGRPNVIVITTDDQDLASLSPRTMPNVMRLLGDRGTTFTNYVASGPLCCPARAVFLTGQYGHNNGVTWNNPGYADLRDKGNTLPVWLRLSGYRTAHVGRYLNRYDRAVPDPNAVAPGWHEWHTAIEPRSWFNYTLRVNGRAVRFGSRPQDHLTRVLNREAVRLVRRHVPRRRPLFLSLDHLAPHGSRSRDPRCFATALPDPRDRDLFTDEPLPTPPSFDESDVSDKPSFVSGRPELTSERIAETTRKHGCRLASLRAVDRGVRQLHRAVREERELRNTVIVFTSDNGWFQGEHRIPEGKALPYEENVHVPLMVRAPPGVIGSARVPRAVGEPVANIDLAPTILDLTGARPCRSDSRCRVLDGRSFVELLRGQPASWPSDRGILLEMEVPSQRAAAFTPCDYEGVRTGGHVYLEHHSAVGPEKGRCEPIEETELYDLLNDPYQLNNLSPADPSSTAGHLERRLAARVETLRDCAGIAGRDPWPASGRYCE